MNFNSKDKSYLPQYHNIMHTIQINDDIYKIPGNWDELTPSSFFI